MTTVSKVTLNGTTLMDATTATANAGKIIAPYTAITADGILTEGTAKENNDELYHLINGTITDAEIDWFKVTDIKYGKFWYCTKLTSVDNPVVENMANDSFRSCEHLKNVEITFKSTIVIYGGNAFNYCYELETVKFHFENSANADTQYGSDMFNQCNKLHTIVLSYKNESHSDKTLKIIYNTFNRASALRTLVLNSENIVIVQNGATSGVFGGIYNNPTESTIFVPQALLSEYQTATNWSTLYSMGVTFAPIEGSIYDD